MDKINPDDLKKKLTYNGGINGEELLNKSAAMLLLVPVHGEYNLIFEKRSSKITQAGDICLPGGMLEGGETSLEAALRETYEEIGVPASVIDIIGNLSPVYTYMGIKIDVYVGVASFDLSEIRINTRELDGWYHLPLSFFLNTVPQEHHVMIKALPYLLDENTGEKEVLFPSEKLGLPETYHSPWGLYKHKIYVYETTFGAIWGITASIIYDFVSKIK